MNLKHQGGFLVSKVHRLSGRILTTMLKRHHIEINPAQGRIMFVLWQQDGIPIQELSKRTSLSKSTLTSMLDRLEDQGYVSRRRCEGDRRTIFIHRTDKDRALEQAYKRVSREMGAIYYKGFKEEEILAFEAALERILKNLSSVAEGADATPDV